MKGSIYKDSSGRWKGVVDLPWKKPDGSRNQKVVRGKGVPGSQDQKKDTQRLLNELIYEIENNLYVQETNATLEQFLKEWFVTYTAELQETTRQLYRMYIDVHVVPPLGQLKLKGIKPMQLQNFYTEKLKKLSPNTVRKLHTFLNRVFDDAVVNRFIKYNPCQGVKQPRKIKTALNVYDEDNFKSLLAGVEGTFDEVCILLAGICGLRRGEIFGLRLRDIDKNNCKITIEETAVRFNGEWIIKPPKSESGKRTITVPGFVLKVISNYLSSLSLVPERVFSEFRPDSYSKHFKRLLESNHLPHIRFHDLRHFNATMMLKYGIPDKVASERLGHSQVQVTRQIYQHVLPSMDIQASQIIENIFDTKAK